MKRYYIQNYPDVQLIEHRAGPLVKYSDCEARAKQLRDALQTLVEHTAMQPYVVGYEKQRAIMDCCRAILNEGKKL